MGHAKPADVVASMIASSKQTLGNIAGGFLFTGLALYLTHKPASPKPAPLAVPMQPAE